MLDTETKRRIDTARDILVGKVPDPKSQVEQITIALIYKFMDDMDAEVEELGGDRSFFAGEFAKFGWGRLMSPSVGGHELLSLYSEGISTMPQNAGIPALFRDIFKNAYLPYRDPETLKSFLKVIDGFTYDHSERLGDAFEYLLSVLGSQGDAGQFRTPRHIIDFMVEILRPQKGEVILDPACGTAGFLISAYKHILRSNLDAQGNSTLTPDEKGLMATNFRGYDISPDMVRLSLVNLYLHGFKSPQIAEYDTLTSEDKWNEFADVILANPPFMSPKGGIKPHKRFSIKAKRSEVLFVDYMAEHLSPRGRAGIIVPEGIIFQSQTAYKDLRKMLVENSLVAVISLPAGVFNPYSGVKTSILILDKSLAKKTDKIAFFKVENDGFGLGAQRRAVEGDDLPFVLEQITNYELRITNGEGENYELGITNDDRVLVVPKSRIAANGDYNLSGERYRESTKNTSLKWEMVELGSLCETKSGTTPSRSNDDYFVNGTIPWVKTLDLNDSSITTTQEKITQLALDETHLSILPVGTVLIAMYGGFNQIGRTGILEIEATHNQAMTALLPTPKVNPYFLNAILVASKDYWKSVANSTRKDPNITKSDVLRFKFPLPPIAIQKEIATEIEGYQKVINGARAVIDNYRPHIPIDPDWEMVELEKLCVIKSGATPDRSNDSFWDGDIPWVTTTLINYEVIHQANEFITLEGLKNSSTWIVPKGTVLMAMYGQGVTRGRVAILGIDAAINQACAAFQIKDNSLVPEYLFSILQSRYEDLRRISEARGGNQSNLSAQVLKEYSIPVPPIDTQTAIVAEIQAEQALVNANRELIERFEKKIQTVLNRIWGGD
jgi:type I restriction enzyme M protein